MNKRTPVYFLALNSVPFLPYAYGILRAFCDSDPRLKENYDWRPPFFLMQNYETILGQIDMPGVVLVSSYVWNFETHDKLVREIKKKWPECTVVIGGNHVPEEREDFIARHPWYDVLVHGEGEHAISRILRQLLTAKNAREGFGRIPGISYLEDGRPRRTGAGIKVGALSEIPSPFLTGIFDPILADLRERGIKYVGLWETNRGCPYSCTFCDWGASTMSKIRGFDFERIAAEIRFFAEQKVEDLYICDANFGILERDLETVNLLIRAKKEYGFPRTIRVNFAKKSDARVLEMSRRLSQNGMLWGTTLSLQSGNADSLSAVKRVNHSFENLVSLAASYRAAEIPNYTEMILGLPHETKETFKKGLCRVLEAGLHEDIRVFELAVLPNAPLTRSTMLKDGGFQTRIKPLLPSIPGFYEEEKIEVVVGNRWMNSDDFVECLVFSEIIQVLHNGGYTRNIARFLSESVGYLEFYEKLIADFIARPDSQFGAWLRDLQALQRAFVSDRETSQLYRVWSHPVFRERLEKYTDGRLGWHTYQVFWIFLNEFIGDFYAELTDWLEDQEWIAERFLSDLVKFQSGLMLTPQYDPGSGKEIELIYDWAAYFANPHGGSPPPRPGRLIFKDETMGSDGRYRLDPASLPAFALAAVGDSYPFSKHRQFTHRISDAQFVLALK